MTDDPLNLAHDWAGQLNESGPSPTLEDWYPVIAFVLIDIAYTLRGLKHQLEDAEKTTVNAAGNGR